MRHAESALCQIGWLSCMGCCGHHFQDKLSVAKGIEKNTLEYGWAVKKGEPVVQWLNRSKDLRKSGVCRNLVYDVDKDKVYCPAHPAVHGLHEGKDPRLNHHHCDILHVCKTAFFYDLWEADRKKEFMDFLRHKKKAGELDWYTYSIKMADDSLLEEFEGLRW